MCFDEIVFLDDGIRTDILDVPQNVQKFVIIAAFHNWNVRTFPASAAGVIGVRKDRYSVMDKGQYLSQENRGLNYENCIVVSGNYTFQEDLNREIRTYGANSYAVTIMAGIIIELSRAEKIKSLNQLKKVLRKHAQAASYPEKVRDKLENSQEPLPLIVFSRLREPYLQRLIERFEEREYTVEVLSENIINHRYIPLDLYWDDAALLDEKNIALINKIYEPDMLVIECEDERIKNKDVIDVSLTNTKREISMLIEKKEYNLGNVKDVVTIIEKTYTNLP